MIYASVELNLKGLKRFQKAVSAGSEVTKKILTQWAARYRGFVQRRFISFSKGGGNWPPLKLGTIRGRIKGKGQGSPAILRNTGVMLAALNPVFVGSPGAYEKYEPMSVTVGFGGPGTYLDGASVSDIASFHNAGAGFLPERKIIVPPDVSTRRGMVSDAERGLGGQAKAMIG
jgi:hypothetical protein